MERTRLFCSGAPIPQQVQQAGVLGGLPLDRAVHHTVVLEFTGLGVQAKAAEQRAVLFKRDALQE